MKTKLALIILAGAFCTSAAAMDASTQEILQVHNKYRSRHHAPPLKWDRELASYAENYAKHCKFAHSHGKYGENLAAGYPTITAAIDQWYSEISKYSYKKPGFKASTGHFTQVVWKGTEKIGCAVITCNGKKGTPGKYLVCEYSPAGNIVNEGYFAHNVLPPVS